MNLISTRSSRHFSLSRTANCRSVKGDPRLRLRLDLPLSKAISKIYIELTILYVLIIFTVIYDKALVNY